MKNILSSLAASSSAPTEMRAAKTKRILQVFEPGVDGVFRHVEGLVEFLLRQKDWKVGIAYSSVRSSEGLFSLVDSVRASGSPAIDLKVGNALGFGDFRALLQLRRLIKDFRPDIVHAHSSKAGGLARLPFVLPNVPTFYTPHAYFGMGPHKGLKSMLFDNIERILATRATTIHVSPEEAEFANVKLRLTSQFEKPIPNGVDITRFCPPSDEDTKSRRKEEFGIPSYAWVLGSIGRLSFQKDPESLYEAFAQLKQRFPDQQIRLLHVCSGNTNELDGIKALASKLGIEKEIVYPSYRKDPQVFFHAMDAFCLTSRYEGMPLSAVEAIASGLPLVLANSPGLRCFGQPDYELNQVYYGDKENALSIANAMSECLLNSDFKNNHCIRAAQHFSNEQCHSSILTLYGRFLRS